MDWNQAKDFLLLGMIGMVAGFIGIEMRALRHATESLSTNVAQLLERMGNHETRITRLEDESE